MKLFFSLVGIAFFLRVLWIYSALVAPWALDPDAPVRACPTGEVRVVLNTNLLDPLTPGDSRVVAETTQFAYPPQIVTAGLKLQEIETSGCRWKLGVLPSASTRSESRRLAVALRHSSLPTVVISSASNPIISLNNGLIARAAFLRFPDFAEIFHATRILVSYGVTVFRSENTLTIALPGGMGQRSAAQ